MTTASPERYALVTGASRGLGRLFALALAQRGYGLVLCARSAEGLQATEQAAVAAGAPAGSTVCVAGDLAQAAGREALQRACAPLPLEMVINNAGFGMGGAFAEQDGAKVHTMLRLNVEALTDVAHRTLPQLLARRGTLVNVASQAAFQPIPYMAAYAASKAYVLHFSEALARELAPKGVRVVCVCPPATATEFFTNAAIDLTQTRLRPLRPQTVVDEAMAAIARGQVVVSPGWINKISNWSSRWLPRSLAVRAAEAMVWRP